MRRFLWASNIPLKASFLIWRLLNGWVPVDTVLQRKGVSLASRCPCYLASEESLVHLFVNGPVASEVWTFYARRFSILDSRVFGVSSLLLLWFCSHGRVGVGHIRVIVPMLVLWFIWKGRNACFFKGKDFSARQVIFQVDQFVVSMGTVNLLRYSNFEGDHDCSWAELVSRPLIPIRSSRVSCVKPREGSFKLNTDASVSSNGAAGGDLLKTYEGGMVFAYYKEFGEVDVLLAEVRSLSYGLQLCQQRGFSSFAIEVDSKSLVRMIQTSVVSDSLCVMSFRGSDTYLKTSRFPCHMFFKRQMLQQILWL